jgi:hypothetical protein
MLYANFTQIRQHSIYIPTKLPILHHTQQTQPSDLIPHHAYRIPGRSHTGAMLLMAFLQGLRAYVIGLEPLDRPLETCQTTRLGCAPLHRPHSVADGTFDAC